MENAISEYRANLKETILKRLKNARFEIMSDGHPIQFELIKDILLNDFKVKAEYTIFTSMCTKTYTYYITGYLQKPEKIQLCVNQEKKLKLMTFNYSLG